MSSQVAPQDHPVDPQDHPVEDPHDRPGGVSVFKIVPPQDGGWSLMPMENLLRGMRDVDDMVSLELFGQDGAVSYGVRTTRAESMNGTFSAHFPQADVSSHKMGTHPGEVDECDLNDWMVLRDDECAMVQTLGLERDSYLPLRVFDDKVIEQAKVDPLAGVIGAIASNTADGQAGGGSNRMGLRLLLRPAPENWSAPWQNLMQARRDGDDRAPKPASSKVDGGDSAPPWVMFMACLAGLAGMNWFFYQNGNIPGMVLFDVGVLALGGLGFFLWRKLFSGSRRPYLDETLVEEKLKSLGFWIELQIVRTYLNLDKEATPLDDIEQVINRIRSFDDPAGNSWQPGRLHRYSGNSVVLRQYRRSQLAGKNKILGWLIQQDYDLHPFVGGSQVLGWLDPKRARRTVLSAREAASVWHPPLGMDEMASMERIASGSLIPYLGDLSSDNEDSGPLVGDSGGRKIRLPESSIQKHAVILGRSGVGKSTLIKHIVHYKLLRKAAGKDNGAIVVIDPHADLVREILTLVPPEIAHKVRLLDFGRTDRVPGINLVDPTLSPDRDRCVDTIINTVKHLWEHWGGRLEDILKNSLLIVYEWNSHPDTAPEDMLTMLDILSLLEDGAPVGKGKDATVEMSAFQRRTLQRVRDPRLKQWFHAYMAWPRDTRAEAVGPVHSRIGAYAANKRAAVIMGQRKSTIVLSDVLSEGLVLLVSTAQGSVGKGPAALMGGTIVSLVESALRDQESMAPSERARCLLVCDEFQTVTGADWEGMFAEIRKYGCSMMLATQSLARLDTPDRHLKAGVLGNVGVIIGYQMAAEDARIISAEMDAERVPERFLINLNPHNCCVRINSDTTCYPAFSMRTLPPPDLTSGSQESVDAVLRGSVEYTVDFAESRTRMDLELQNRLDGGDKLGMASDDEKTPGSAGITVFDKANDGPPKDGRKSSKKEGGATDPGNQRKSSKKEDGDSVKADGDSGDLVKTDGDSGGSVKADGSSLVSGPDFDPSDFDASTAALESEPTPESESFCPNEPTPEWAFAQICLNLSL